MRPAIAERLDNPELIDDLCVHVFLFQLQLFVWIQTTNYFFALLARCT